MVEEGVLLWSPRREFAQESNLKAYMRWLSAKGRHFGSYDALWRWSVDDTDDFWASMWDYFDIKSDAPYSSVRSGDTMADTRWFDGARINLAEHMLRHEAHATRDEVAIHHLSEVRPHQTMTWHELGDRVRTTATAMRALGIQPGDRVAACLPNIAEAAIALMATAAIGAIWTAVAPEFGPRAAIDRLSQVKPKLLFVTDGYRYAGIDRDCAATTSDLIASLETVEHVVLVPNLDPAVALPADRRFSTWAAMQAVPAPTRERFEYTRVANDHPLWVLFTSGTTGLPKAIVHGQLGITLELFRAQVLSGNVGAGSTMFSYASTAWVVWNMVVGALVTGTSIVLYDGHALADGADTIWRIAEQTRATDISFSPNLANKMIEAGSNPGTDYDLSSLRHVILVGSPALPDVFEWILASVSADAWITSQAGSTELCCGFAGGVPTLPVRAGEIQARLLGMAIECWSDDGRSMIDEIGELVLTRPCPMMPLGLWGDADGSRYRESYFADFPGIWRQGDRCRITPHGGLAIYGRSDATLNRGGVRIGTAEIYRSVCDMDEVRDAIVTDVAFAGQSRMILFVMLAEGQIATSALRARIGDRLRAENSPRHVPDDIVDVPVVPYTATGKRMEVPLRRLLNGADVNTVADRNAMADPLALDWYVAFAGRFHAETAVAI